MAALAYLLPPITGMVAFFSTSERTRLHGFQAVVLGLVWPGSLYLCSFVSPVAVQAAFVLGALGWLTLVVATAMGHDPTIPGIDRWTAGRNASN